MTDRIIDWPADLVNVQSRGFRLVSRNLQSSALITGEVTPSGPVVQRWIARLSYPAKREADWRRISGLLAGLRGTQGFLRIGDPMRRMPYHDRTVARTTEAWDDSTSFDDDTGWVSGPLPQFVAAAAAAARSARSILLSGLPASTAGVLGYGDLFEIRPSGVPAAHGHLYEVTGTANSDSSGESRVYFEPGLRTGVAAGDMVVLTEPRSVFRLADEDQGEMEVDNALFGRIGLSLIEVLPRS